MPGKEQKPDSEGHPTLPETGSNGETERPTYVQPPTYKYLYESVDPDKSKKR